MIVDLDFLWLLINLRTMLKEAFSPGAQKFYDLISSQNQERYEGGLNKVLRWQGDTIKGKETVLEHIVAGLQLINEWFAKFPVLKSYFDQIQTELEYGGHDAGELIHAKGEKPRVSGKPEPSGNDLILTNPEARASAEAKEQRFALLMVQANVENPALKEFFRNILLDYNEHRTPESYLVHFTDKVQAVIHGNEKIYPYYGENAPEELQKMIEYGIDSVQKARQMILKNVV